MELNFSWKRIALLLGLLATFWLLGGFDCPTAAPGSLPDSHSLAKAWRQSVLLFIAGAVAASLVDHYVGTMDRSNVRLLYILTGSLVMIVSLFWIRALQGPQKPGDEGRPRVSVRGGEFTALTPSLPWRALRPWRELLFQKKAKARAKDPRDAKGAKQEGLEMDWVWSRAGSLPTNQGTGPDRFG